MIINNTEFDLIDTPDNCLTVTDCFVIPQNKIGSGSGEARFYISSSKKKMVDFFGGQEERIDCFILKKDLVTYMMTIENFFKSNAYVTRNNFSKKEIIKIWDDRIKKLQGLPDLIGFKVDCQLKQEKSNRGYVKSSSKVYKNINDRLGFEILREFSIVGFSYVTIKELREKSSGKTFFYWKLFADFCRMEDRLLAVENYKKNKKKNNLEAILTSHPIKYRTVPVRTKQSNFRDKLLEENNRCFITKISEAKLLIASHIKPFATCNDNEKYDPNNGLILSPLYDKLFDLGFLSFTDDQKVHISDWLSIDDRNKLGIKENQKFPDMKITDKRAEYLDYHRKYIFRD